MNFLSREIYHLYNRGNNKDIIFFNQNNYLFFLEKLRKHLLIHFDFLAYCLMPNHFHLLVVSKENIENEKAIRAIAVLLSSYSQAINKQEKRTGSIFQKKTRAKLLKANTEYLKVCLHYIHQNPYKAKLVDKLEDWEFSSFRDYAGLRNDSLCNIPYCYNIFGINDINEFYDLSYSKLEENIIKNIFN